MKKIAIYAFVVMLMAAACSGPLPAPETGAIDEVPQASDAQAADEESVEAVAEDTEAEPPAEEVVAEAEATEPEAEEAVVEESTDSEPEVADIGPPPEFTTELKATDPDTVLLGNGKPQVVEFFAFW